MRKFIKQLLCCMLCISIMAVPFAVMADESQATMNASWKTNYGQVSVLTVRFKSPAQYAQQVTAVMYPYDTVNPSVANYCRMKEVTSLYGEETTVSFVLGNDLTAIDGKYKIKLQGSGYMHQQSNEVIDVVILNPSTSSSLLTRINGATTTSAVASLLAEGDAALQLDLETDPILLEKLMVEFLRMKTYEYQNSFADLNDVCDAYIKSSIMVCLNEATVTPSVLRAKVEANAELVGLDITNEDYLSVAERVYQKIISVKTTYGGTGILSCAQLVDAIEKTTVVELVNMSNITDINSVLNDYYTVLGIDGTYYSKFVFLSDANKDKVLRQIYNKNFTFAYEVKAAFESGVDGVIGDAGGTDTGVGKEENHVGLGGGGGGGGNSEIVIEPEITPSLTDINSSHWAYDYVDALSKNNIISGYPDGTFRPENRVTREEFVKMVISAAGLYDQNAECEFDDISADSWAYRYISSAKNANIVGGISESHFGAGQNISRQDVAVIVARVIDYFKKTSSADAKDVQTAYPDNDSVSEYARASVNVLTNMGIINGYDSGNFGPLDSLTRAQAAKIIYMLRKSI